MNYLVPSAADLPYFDVRTTETPTTINILGSKGIGQGGAIGAAPAVQNAVIDALAPIRCTPHRHAARHRNASTRRSSAAAAQPLASRTLGHER